MPNCILSLENRCICGLATNRYKYETPVETETGFNYKSMIIYNLVVLFSTALITIAYGSVIWKNINDGAIGGIRSFMKKARNRSLSLLINKQHTRLIRRLFWNETASCSCSMKTVNFMECLGIKRRKSNMRKSYNSLWKLMIDKNMRKYDFEKMWSDGTSYFAKLGEEDNVTTDVMMWYWKSVLLCDTM